MLRQINFVTPCGFHIYLIRSLDGVSIRSMFNGGPCSFVNGLMSLSDEGARMLRDKLNEFLEKG